MASQVFWRRALTEPGQIVAIEPDGTAHTAGDLLARVNQLTHGLRARGLRTGDGLAVLVPNGIAALEVYLAALQSGWYLTPVNWHFTVPEIAYILRDCEAKVFFVHERFAEARAGAADESGLPVRGRICYGEVPGFTPVESVREGQSPDVSGWPGGGHHDALHLGTTGRPKGVRRELSGLTRRRRGTRIIAAAAFRDHARAAERAFGHLAALSHGGVGVRRRVRFDGPLSCLHGRVGRGARARGHRALPGDEHAHGAHALRPAAGPAGGDEAALRPVLDALDPARGGALPGRR
jgi:non-ribosomal peptide synthetase component F